MKKRGKKGNQKVEEYKGNKRRTKRKGMSKKRN